MMSRPPIFQPPPGPVMRAGEGEEHDFLRAEQAANITGPHPAGNELYSMISHLSNLLSEKYPHDGDKSDPYPQNDDDIDTFTPQEVLQATRLIRLLKQSIRGSQRRQQSRPLRVNEARLDSRPASFGAVGVAPPPCSKGNEDRSPKRSDSGWQQGSQFPAAWESGESQGSITGVKSAQERDETVRQPNSTEARQSDPYLDGQPASSRPQILATKRFPDTLGKASGAKCVTTSSKETPRAIASYPRPQRSTGEQPELLASRGTFEQAMPENNPLLDKFLSGAHGIAPFPAEADVGEEAQEIQECPYCHRTFASKSFEKHVKVCVKWGARNHRQAMNECARFKKVFFTRRKKYDMTRKRLASVVEEAGLPVHSTVQKLRGELSSKPLEKRTEKKWQRESAQFRAAMRMARAGDPREIAEAQAIFAKCSDMGVNKQCQHCGRTFGREEALEKHEGVCQRMFKNGGGILRKGGGLCAAQGAACRLARNATMKKKGQHSMDFSAPKRNIDPSSWGYQHRSASQARRSSKLDVASITNQRKATGPPSRS